MKWNALANWTTTKITYMSQHFQAIVVFVLLLEFVWAISMHVSLYQWNYLQVWLFWILALRLSHSWFGFFLAFVCLIHKCCFFPASSSVFFERMFQTIPFKPLGFCLYSSPTTNFSRKCLTHQNVNSKNVLDWNTYVVHLNGLLKIARSKPMYTAHIEIVCC